MAIEITRVQELEHVNCQLCGSSDAALLYHKRDRLYPNRETRYTMVRCVQCGFTYQCPRPTPSTFQSYYKEDYPAHQQVSVSTSAKPKQASVGHLLRHLFLAYPNGHSVIKKPILRELLKAVLLPIFLVWRNRAYYRIPKWVDNGRCLDIGCGNGSYLLRLKSLGWQVAGNDTTTQAVTTAQEAGLDVRLGTIENCNFQDNSFDIVTTWTVMISIHDIQATLNEVRRILKPDGMLVVGVPNVGSRMGRLLKDKWAYIDLPRDLYHFSRTTLVAILERNGFRVIRTRYKIGAGGDYIGDDLMRYLRNMFTSGNKNCNEGKDRRPSLLEHIVAHTLGYILCCDGYIICEARPK